MEGLLRRDGAAAHSPATRRSRSARTAMRGLLAGSMLVLAGLLFASSILLQCSDAAVRGSVSRSRSPSPHRPPAPPLQFQQSVPPRPVTRPPTVNGGDDGYWRYRAPGPFDPDRVPEGTRTVLGENNLGQRIVYVKHPRNVRPNWGQQGPEEVAT